MVFYYIVLGEREKTARTANVRTRENKVLGERSVDDLIARFKELTEKKTLNSEDAF